jgi:hypothetical protein
MRARAHQPQDQPRFHGGLARTATSLHRKADRLIRYAIADCLSQTGQELALPFVWTIPAFEVAMLPVEGVEDEAERIVVELSHVLGEREVEIDFRHGSRHSGLPT